MSEGYGRERGGAEGQIVMPFYCVPPGAAGLAVARPAVVIAAADPPMAKRAAAAAFADLAAEATVAWLVPGKSEGLVSPAFADVPGVTVFAEHAAVADDIGDMLLWPGAVSVPRQGTGR